MISQAEKFREDSEWGDLHELYWRIYLSEPSSKTRSWPWENSSNLFIPLTKVACDAIVAQEFDAMLSNDPRVVGMEASDYQFAEDLTQYYFEYFYKEICPLQVWGTDWLLNNTVDGTASVKVRQNRDFIVRREESVETYPSSYEAMRVDEFTGETVRYDVPFEDYRRVEKAYVERVDQTEVTPADLEALYVAAARRPALLQSF